MISVFDIFKIGIGPSSSHTLGPMKAGKRFVDELIAQQLLDNTTALRVEVYGSLSLTGIGHHTDIAIILGLAGYSPEDVDIDGIPALISQVKQTQRLSLQQGHHQVDFPRDSGILFCRDSLPRHENGMKFYALYTDQVLYSATYYSTGGGFIVDENEFNQSANTHDTVDIPYPFYSADKLINFCQQTSCSIDEIILQNELVWHDQPTVQGYFERIWLTMLACIERGCQTDGILPGPLKVPRRAAKLYRLLIESSSDDPLQVMDWVSMYALAVNEENAAGGRIVTAPTNGACGIIPATLSYFNLFLQPLSPAHLMRYFLTTGAIAILYKMNASISGAEVGCQGEVGVACSMAAAGLAALQGATPMQVCIAAEIGMEHFLGLTCDPVAGQVQVPCIERNAMASIQAINASRMALRRSTNPCVSLDHVIRTMYETGKDINAKYRETSQGGLALVMGPCD